jgi:hypothetical protein
MIAGLSRRRFMDVKKPIAAVALVLVLAECSCFVVSGAEVVPKVTSMSIQGRGQYVGFLKCADCHFQQESKLDQADDGILLPRDFINRTEARTWYYKDKHAKAFDALKSNLGKRIGEVLRKESGQNPECLSCHSASIKDQVLGVACEACHGPASDWWVPHSDSSWRRKSTNEKQQLGMVDVRNPDIRDRKCFSCHIGNPLEKKMVTHEMYAAGHPPLPSFEIESQLRKMPAHWKNLSDKPKDFQRFMNFDPNEMYRTKSVVLGGVLAYREWLNFLAANSPAKIQGGWTDFAVYDCYSCHHDLKYDSKSISWRQERGYSGTAGQPPLADWPQALVKLAIFHVSGKDPETYKKRFKEFSDKVQKVSRTQNPKAFRDNSGVMAVSTRDAAMVDLVAWLGRLAAEVETSRFDRTETRRLLRQLTVINEVDDPNTKTLPDYSTARQIAWAIRSLYADLTAGKKDGDIEKIINTVDLELPGRRQAEASYDPRRFKEQVSRVSQLLPP